jgi:uncharacterized protein
VKNILTHILVTSSFVFTCCGQGDKKVKDQPVQRVNGLPARPVGWVSDLDSIFNPAQIKSLDSIIAKHETETTNEVAIVTYGIVPGPPGDTDRVKNFSLALFDKWGVGKKEKNNGVGILVLKDERKIRIEVGYGLEKKLTDQEAKAIIDSIIIPEFRREDYYTGVLQGLQAIFKEIK